AFAAARAACTAAGDDAGLVRVLRNHATYLRATGDPTAAAALAAEADAKVRDAGLLTGIWSPR
ncbi:MAG: hypothetical protein KDE27_28705, partial [Planctomycetes bacterium]|nr:hypothetical protein [Planctomycetota bacterium]